MLSNNKFFKNNKLLAFFLSKNKLNDYHLRRLWQKLRTNVIKYAYNRI